MVYQAVYTRRVYQAVYTRRVYQAGCVPGRVYKAGCVPGRVYQAVYQAVCIRWCIPG